MKHMLVTVFFLTMAAQLSAVSSIDEAESVFREGNVAFQRDDFEGAVKAYQGLIDDGYESGKLYYNLGNAHYREGNIAQAILDYERAT